MHIFEIHSLFNPSFSHIPHQKKRLPQSTINSQINIPLHFRNLFACKHDYVNKVFAWGRFSSQSIQELE